MDQISFKTINRISMNLLCIDKTLFLKDEVIKDTGEPVIHIRSLKNEDKVHAFIIRKKQFNLSYKFECLRKNMKKFLYSSEDYSAFVTTDIDELSYKTCIYKTYCKINLYFSYFFSKSYYFYA